jgi:hypothetical protein
VYKVFRFLKLPLIFMVLLAALPLGSAQNAVEYLKIVEARTLSGLVVLENTKDPVDSVLVEDCSSDWQTVNQTAHTDPAGHFVFPHAERRLHYLRLTAPGMRMVKIRVRVLPLSPKSEARIEMPVAM